MIISGKRLTKSPDSGVLLSLSEPSVYLGKAISPNHFDCNKLSTAWGLRITITSEIKIPTVM